jgi:hypothetical protein
VLWWAHSLWALAWGVAVMWLGTRRFAWLRLAFVYIAVIWATSRFLPALAASPRLSPAARAWIRPVVGYFNRNFYQQLLFFVLPLYAASVTWSSPNVLFVVIVAASAVLSTLDRVYDRHLSASRGLGAVFFAFNLFVCVNVALPVLWHVSNVRAMRVSGALALLGFLTLRFHPRDVTRPDVRAAAAGAAVLLAFFIEWGRPLIPPAPLRLAGARFGTGLDRGVLAVTRPLDALPAGFDGRLYAVTAIHAPLGMRERVRHRWTRAGRDLHRSPYYTVAGGRTQGYRLWTTARVDRRATSGSPGSAIDVWVETEAGQVIGRARLPAR